MRLESQLVEFEETSHFEQNVAKAIVSLQESESNHNNDDYRNSSDLQLQQVRLDESCDAILELSLLYLIWYFK